MLFLFFIQSYSLSLRINAWLKTVLFHIWMFEMKCTDVYLHDTTLIILGVTLHVKITENQITHWGRVTHICFNKLTNIGSDKCLWPGRHQAIIWANDKILLIGPLATNFSEILINIQTIPFKKMHLKMSSAKYGGILYCLQCVNESSQ